MTPLRVGTERDGAVVRLTLARPKGNVLDAEMVGALRGAIGQILPEGPVKLVVVDHDGPHFSFGASVEEHLPGRVARMLHDFHRMFRDLEGLGIPTAAVVRGQCLGGGLELAIACGRVFVHPDSKLGLPEVKLGVFPPLGAVLLPFRVRMADAVELVLSGATVDGRSAVGLGLADEVADDPWAACLAWFDQRLAAHSATAVRAAWRAVRRPVARALGEELAAVENLYLEDLMHHRDPVEGLRAFVEGRPPVWEHA
ncbi:MAG: enoyl-CoA hydratase/isomerase family protein [Myxococcota bacterium]